MYHFTDIQLKVVHAICHEPENAKYLKKCRLIILEHLLPTTEEFVKILDDVGVEVFVIVAKPYSKVPAIHQRLCEKGYRVIDESYEALETTTILHDALAEAVAKSKKDGRLVAVVDVGGYFAKPLSKVSDEEIGHVAGVVEDTTFGHNRYLNLIQETAQLEKNKVLKFPIVSVARSELKEIEARFVGRDAVQAMDLLLRDLGISITGRNALVIGYGMIGKNVARTLRSYDLNVYVYDKVDTRLVQAFNDGFHIHKKVLLLRHADIIFSATGSMAIHGCPAMTFEEIEDCKNGVVLASVGSKNNEFDVDRLEHMAVEKETLLEQNLLVKYTLPNSKYVILAKQGTAVNFYLPSIPREILDLVFSEILLGILSLLRNRGECQIGTLNFSSTKTMSSISKAWLRMVNMEAQA